MNLASVTRPATDCRATLILLHGLGSDEQDMFGLAEQIPSNIEVICLRAPHRYGPGYAWFDIQWTFKGIQVDENQMRDSLATVSEFVTELGRKNLIIGGFSQGAIMALSTISESGDQFVGGILLSGRQYGNDCPNFNGKVFQAHGAFDDVIPIRDGLQLREQLSPLGDRLEFHQYEMGHWICDEEIRDLNHWLQTSLELK